MANTDYFYQPKVAYGAISNNDIEHDLDNSTRKQTSRMKRFANYIRFHTPKIHSNEGKRSNSTTTDKSEKISRQNCGFLISSFHANKKGNDLCPTYF